MKHPVAPPNDAPTAAGPGALLLSTTLGASASGGFSEKKMQNAIRRARLRYHAYRFVCVAVAFFWIGVGFAGLIIWVAG